MKILVKSLFLGLTLSILSYSAIAAGPGALFASEAEGRTCCTYQVNCPEDQECKTIYPECSQENPHICKKASSEADLVTLATP
jgi:hypothetical protein